MAIGSSNKVIRQGFISRGTSHTPCIATTPTIGLHGLVIRFGAIGQVTNRIQILIDTIQGGSMDRDGRITRRGGTPMAATITRMTTPTEQGSTLGRIQIVLILISMVAAPIAIGQPQPHRRKVTTFLGQVAIGTELITLTAPNLDISLFLKNTRRANSVVV